MLRLAAILAAVLGVVALLIGPAARGVTRPLERLTTSARQFAAGDFSHRVPVEGPREVARLAEEMNEMAQRLATVLHTQRQLLADVSHEFRSPLSRIEVALELARAEAGRKNVELHHLESIAGDVAELTRLVRDALTASRLELRPDLVALQDVPVSDLLAEAHTKALAAGMPQALLSLEDASRGSVVRADAQLVAHALSNLIDNARKHTPPGTAVVLGSRAEGSRILLFVRDAGSGIPAEELPRLFEPFYRPDSSRTRIKGGGAGLGLSLVRRIAELHGAPPVVESTPQVGSTFGLTLAPV